VKEDYPAYMVSGGDNARGRVSRHLLSSEDKFTYEEWKETVFSTYSIVAEETIPEIEKEWEAYKKAHSMVNEELSQAMAELSSWDSIFTIESIPSTLFFLWVEKMYSSPPPKEKQKKNPGKRLKR